MKTPDAGRPHLAEEMAAAGATFGYSLPCSHTVLGACRPGRHGVAVVEPLVSLEVGTRTTGLVPPPPGDVGNGRGHRWEFFLTLQVKGIV